MPRKKSPSSSAIEKKIQALPEDVRDRVLERAAILWESGVPDDEVNQLAFDMEVASKPGVASTGDRSPLSTEPLEKEDPTGTGR